MRRPRTTTAETGGSMVTTACNLVSASFTKPTARIRSQTLGSTAFDGMAKGPIKLEGLQSGAPLMYSDYYHAW
eukprot:scaffold18952_cov72-Phaeocystis_antarctica.AAC.3